MCTPFSTLLLSSSVLILFSNNIQPDSSLETDDMAKVKLCLALCFCTLLGRIFLEFTNCNENTWYFTLLLVVSGTEVQPLLYTWTMIWKFIVFICEALGSQFEQVIECLNLYLSYSCSCTMCDLSCLSRFKKYLGEKGFEFNNSVT